MTNEIPTYIVYVATKANHKSMVEPWESAKRNRTAKLTQCKASTNPSKFQVQKKAILSTKSRYFRQMEASEKSIKTTKTARYYQLGECNMQTKRVWIVLHGYGQLASYFIKHFAPLADAETCIVAPEGLSRFYLDGKWDRVGATWMTKEDRLHEIEDYVEYLDKMMEALIGDLEHKPEIIMLAFSQGTATAWRWLMKGKVRPSQFVMWAGGPATDAMDKARERFTDCGLHFVLGDTDEYIRLEDAEKQFIPLRQLKSDIKFWTFVGNHRMDAEVLKALNDSWA